MNGHVVGVLLVREGSYAVQIVLAHRLLPGARLEPVPVLSGDVINPLALVADAVILSNTGHAPPGVKAFQVMCDG